MPVAPESKYKVGNSRPASLEPRRKVPPKGMSMFRVMSYLMDMKKGGLGKLLGIGEGLRPCEDGWGRGGGGEHTQ